MKKRAVCIEWFDAFSDAHEWTAVKDLDTKRRKIVTVGLLIGSHQGYHMIAMSWDTHTKHVGNVLHIPEVNVISMNYLEVVG